MAPKKIAVDLNLFGWKPVNRVNGVPWPRLDLTVGSTVNVPLKQEYLLRSMDYLDTDAAKVIFEAQADIVLRNGFRGIVDVGCRIGRINDILLERGYADYRYMGFDTSPEPIKYSQSTWAEFKNIEYRCTSWDDRESIAVDFPVDCVIWSGVLLYRPQDHQKLFHDLTVDFYRAGHAIIQEPMREQTHWARGLALDTIVDQLEAYKARYAEYREAVVEADIFSGRRKIVEIKI